MYSNYINDLVKLRDYAARLGSDFEIAQVRSLILRHRDISTKAINYTEILPRPFITTAYPILERVDGISLQIMTGDFQVKGISRKYPRAQLIGSRIDYIIDGILIDDKVQSGITCELISATENTLTWDLLLRQKFGEQKLS